MRTNLAINPQIIASNYVRIDFWVIPDLPSLRPASKRVQRVGDEAGFLGR